MDSPDARPRSSRKRSQRRRGSSRKRQSRKKRPLRNKPAEGEVEQISKAAPVAGAEQETEAAAVETVADDDCNVRVYCRVRPLNERELGEQALTCVEFPSESQLLITPPDNKDKAYCFSFDRVFAPHAEQGHVFDAVAKPMVREVFNGFNSTIFAYGQTGSGKTHTMTGQHHTDERGIIPRLVEAVFSRIEASPSSIRFTVKLSFVEVYKEKIRDLLEPSSTQLKIREGQLGVYIQGVTEHYVGDVAGVLDVIQQGERQRAVGSTAMNQRSSRSHACLLLSVGQVDEDSGVKKGAKLTLVDLAGSEQVRKSKAGGERLEEAKHINRSLSALGNVINALSTRAGFVPYRDSKLTRLLSDSLGGNSKTCLVITCSPSACSMPETISTLRFGNRAKAIKNKPKANEELSLAQYKRMFLQCNKRLRLLEERLARCRCAGDGVVCGESCENNQAREEDREARGDNGMDPTAFPRRTVLGKLNTCPMCSSVLADEEADEEVREAQEQSDDGLQGEDEGEHKEEWVVGVSGEIALEDEGVVVLDNGDKPLPLTVPRHHHDVMLAALQVKCFKYVQLQKQLALFKEELDVLRTKQDKQQKGWYGRWRGQSSSSSKSDGLAPNNSSSSPSSPTPQSKPSEVLDQPVDTRKEAESETDLRPRVQSLENTCKSLMQSEEMLRERLRSCCCDSSMASPDTILRMQKAKSEPPRRTSMARYVHVPNGDSFSRAKKDMNDYYF